MDAQKITVAAQLMWLSGVDRPGILVFTQVLNIMYHGAFFSEEELEEIVDAAIEEQTTEVRRRSN